MAWAWVRRTISDIRSPTRRRIFLNKASTLVAPAGRFRFGWLFLRIGLFTYIAWAALAAYFAYLHPYVGRLVSGSVWADFDRTADRARGTALLDAEGRYIGVLHSGFEADHLGELPKAIQYSGYVVYPDHKAIPIDDAPEFFWRCLVYHEDKSRGWPDNPHGVSFSGILRIPDRTLIHILATGKPGLGAGGSTLEMQLARSLWKRYSHNSNPLIRKFQEWNAAPVLNRELQQGADGERRLRAWVAQHIALVQAAGDEQDIFGVEAAGRFMFGRPAAELDAAEQILLASAVKRPLRMKYAASERQKEILALVGSEETPGRALQCASRNAVLSDGRPVISDPALAEATRSRLLHIHEEPSPAIHPDFLPFITDLVEHPAGSRTAPQRLAAELAYGLQTEVVGSLADLLDQGWERGEHPWRGKVSEVQLTMDMARNLQLSDAVSEAVHRIEPLASAAAQGGLLHGTLSAPDRWGHKVDASLPAAQRVPYVRRQGYGVPLMIAVANGDGEIVRFINTGQDSNYFGGAGQRRDVGYFGNGRYLADSERRMIGSVGKVVAALLISETGELKATDPVSNRCPPGISSNCMSTRTFRGGYATVPFDKAVAESLNAATINAFSAHVKPRRAKDFMETLGFNLRRADEDTPVYTNVVLGRYTARPHTVHKLMMLALAYAQGRYEAEFPEPHLLKAWRRFDPATDRYLTAGLEPAPVRLMHVADHVAPGGAQFVRQALQAPVCRTDSDDRASLRRLKDWCPGAHPDVVMHIAKTGTVPAPDKNGFDESDWWIAGGIQFRDGRSYTYVVTAGVGDASLPFARQVGASRLAEIVDVVLDDLLQAPE